ncbi:MAG: pyridoxal-phosphate dependent enzyme, partial [Pseudomonadota bacterium]
MIRTPTSKGVVEAAKAVAAMLPPTPFLPITIKGTQCWVKAENLQPIGAFKIRGAWWALSNLEDDRVVAVSSGNHAQGIAWAAQQLSKKATIVMPHDAPQVKLDNTRSLGAEIVLYQRPGEDRDEVASKLIDENGGTLVHAFGNPWVIEGQGTAGIEITQQLGREPSAVIACCGGGGLAG